MAVRPSRLAACFLLGAALGTGLDAIHAYGDVLEYPNETFGELAWFVPLEFGLLGLGAGLAMPWLESLAGKPQLGDREATTFGKVLDAAKEVGLFAVLYFLTTLPETDVAAIALLVALLALVAIRLVSSPIPGEGMYVGLAIVVGFITEATLLLLDVFDYTAPAVLGVPWWLPGLWANAGLLVRRLLWPVVIIE